MFPLFERVSAPRVSSELPALISVSLCLKKERRAHIGGGGNNTEPQRVDAKLGFGVLTSTKTGRLQLPEPTT